MSFLELAIISVSLSMDAFAVSVCKGLSMQVMSWKKSVVVGLYFGFFQAGMPLLGYMLGVQFRDKITFIDHWIAFVLLVVIGISMIKEARGEGEKCDASIGYKSMTMLALATSIDALAVGVTFAFLNVNIGPAVVFIGMTTFVLSVVGVKLGNVFGAKYKSKAEIAGGIALILMGIKILLEHLGIINF